MSLRDKILDEATLAEILASHRRAGRRIVLSNGAYDLLHVGHIRALEEAAGLGGVLVVAVNADDSVRAAKGPGRPLVPAAERAEVVAALDGVDYVVVFDDATVDRLLEVLRPDVHAKGRDYTPDTIPERATDERLGIEIAIVGDSKAHSSTRLLAEAAGSIEVQDRVLALDHPDVRGYVSRSVRRLLRREGWLDLERLVTTEEGAIVEAHRTRHVRRLEIAGTPVYVKVGRPAERRRSAIVEFQHHLALRAAGFRAPEPWLCAEGRVGGRPASALVTREAPGLALDEFLALQLPRTSPREALAMARGLGVTLRALHTARFFSPDLQAWHLLVEGTPAGGRRAITFVGLQRLSRGGVRLRRRTAADGLAALALSLLDVADERWRLAVLRAYLGGTLRHARPWLRLIERRMERRRRRGTFKRLDAARRASGDHG